MVSAELHRRVGRNVAYLRGGLSQQAVADAMRHRGHKWSQATVWSVEKGERPLRFLEAVDLAICLGGVPLSTLLNEPSEVATAGLLARSGHRYTRALSAAYAAIGEANGAREALRLDIDQAEREGTVANMGAPIGSAAAQLAIAKKILNRSITDSVDDGLREEATTEGWGVKRAKYLARLQAESGAVDGEHPETS